MSSSITKVMVASLLCSTAMVSVAMAQETGAAAAPAAGTECQELDTLVQENEGVIEQGWLDQAGGIVTGGDAATCAAWLTTARDTLQVTEVGGAAEMLEGRIVVRQPEPEVIVRQAAPQVAVTQPRPQVQVRQAQPEIIVRQAQPIVRITMPNPTVTIEQPEPEIIVRMPEPEVAVTQAQPQVEVTQAQPQVEVQQGEAQIDVQVDETPEVQPTEGAQVQVEQAQPLVQLETAEQAAPQVNLEQAQPQVSFEAAEPIVEIEGGGEPQVQFTQTGEPNIRMAEEGEDLAQAETGVVEGAEGATEGAEGVMDNAAGAVGGAATGLADATAGAVGAGEWREDRNLLAAPPVEREGYQLVEPATLTAEQLQDAEVYGVDDQQIASVDTVQLGQDGQIQYFVMDVGGFLGLGSRNVAIGFDEATIVRDEGGEHRIYVEATQEQLESIPEHRAMTTE